MTSQGEESRLCDSSQLLILIVMVSVALVERRDAVIAVIDQMKALPKASIVQHGSAFVLCWLLTVLSLGPTPRLAIFTAQAVIGMIFWAGEYVRASWTKQCHVTHGTMVLSLVSLAARLFANLKTEAYLPVGWSGEGLYQSIEFGTAVVIMVLLLATVQIDGIKTAPTNGVYTKPPLLIGFAVGLACGEHLDLAKNFLFDSIWAFSWFLDCFTQVPQLEAIAAGNKCGLHFASLITLSMYRLLGIFFWIDSYQAVSTQKAFLLCSFQVFASCLLIMMVVISHLNKEFCDAHYQQSSSNLDRIANSPAENQQMKEAPALSQVF